MAKDRQPNPDAGSSAQPSISEAFTPVMVFLQQMQQQTESMQRQHQEQMREQQQSIHDQHLRVIEELRATRQVSMRRRGLWVGCCVLTFRHSHGPGAPRNS